MIVDQELLDKLKARKEELWAKHKAAEDEWSKAAGLYSAAKLMLDSENKPTETGAAA